MTRTSRYNQLQKYLRHCTVFWHEWPVHDLVLVIPPPSLIKVASNARPYSKLGGTTLNGREEGCQYDILQTCDQERFEARKVVFPWECLIIFATGWVQVSLGQQSGQKFHILVFAVCDFLLVTYPNERLIKKLALTVFSPLGSSFWSSQLLIYI